MLLTFQETEDWRISAKSCQFFKRMPPIIQRVAAELQNTFSLDIETPEMTIETIIGDVIAFHTSFSRGQSDASWNSNRNKDQSE